MSVLETGSFGAKRRQKQQTTPIPSMNLEVCSKRFKLNEHRESISPIVDESIPYVDVGEFADTGIGMFSIERMTVGNIGKKKRRNSVDPVLVSSDSTFQKYEIQVLENDAFPTICFKLTGLDLRGLRVFLKYKSEPAQPEVVLWSEGMDMMCKRNRLLAKRKYKHWLKRASDKVTGKDLAARIFTSSVMGRDDGVAGFLSRVNRALAQPMNNVMRDIMKDSSVNDLKVDTVGQMIVAFLLRGGHYVQGRPSFKTRLMFLFLEYMVDSHGERSDAILFSHLHSWLVKRTCDSCFEKVLFTREEDPRPMHGKYPYSLESCALNLNRYLSIAPGAGLDYEIRSHSEMTEADPDRTVWKQWTHGYIRPRYVYGIVQFRIASENDSDDLIIDVPQHWGMSLITCLDGLYKGLKHATFGGGNEGLIRWAQNYDLVVGNNLTCLKKILVDLTYIYENFAKLRCLVENVFGYVLLCVIPRDLSIMCYAKVRNGNQESIDFYDLMVRFCSSTRSNTNGYLMESILVHNSPETRLGRLHNEDVMMTLIHYIPRKDNE